MMMSIKYDDITGTHFLLFSVSLPMIRDIPLYPESAAPATPRVPQVTTEHSCSHLETLAARLSDLELGRSFSVYLGPFWAVSVLSSDS